MIVQRTLAAKNLSHAKGGSLMAAYLKVLPLFIMVFPGMVSRVLFPGKKTAGRRDFLWVSDPVKCSKHITDCPMRVRLVSLPCDSTEASPFQYLLILCCFPILVQWACPIDVPGLTEWRPIQGFASTIHFILFIYLFFALSTIHFSYLVDCTRP